MMADTGDVLYADLEISNSDEDGSDRVGPSLRDEQKEMDLMDEGLTSKFKATTSSRPPGVTPYVDIQVEKLKHDLAAAKKANAVLEQNLILLYKTAHHIIRLKDKEISNLRSKYDAMCFRRREQNDASALPSVAPSGTRRAASDLRNASDPNSPTVPTKRSVPNPMPERGRMSAEFAMLQRYNSDSASKKVDAIPKSTEERPALLNSSLSFQSLTNSEDGKLKTNSDETRCTLRRRNPREQAHTPKPNRNYSRSPYRENESQRERLSRRLTKSRRSQSPHELAGGRRSKSRRNESPGNRTEREPSRTERSQGPRQRSDRQRSPSRKGGSHPPARGSMKERQNDRKRHRSSDRDGRNEYNNNKCRKYEDNDRSSEREMHDRQVPKLPSSGHRSLAKRSNSERIAKNNSGVSNENASVFVDSFNHVIDDQSKKHAVVRRQEQTQRESTRRESLTSCDSPPRPSRQKSLKNDCLPKTSAECMLPTEQKKDPSLNENPTTRQKETLPESKLEAIENFIAKPIRPGPPMAASSNPEHLEPIPTVTELRRSPRKRMRDRQVVGTIESPHVPRSSPLKTMSRNQRDIPTVSVGTTKDPRNALGISRPACLITLHWKATPTESCSLKSSNFPQSLQSSPRRSPRKIEGRRLSEVPLVRDSSRGSASSNENFTAPIGSPRPSTPTSKPRLSSGDPAESFPELPETPGKNLSFSDNISLHDTDLTSRILMFDSIDHHE